jgi:hypothetical protein
MSAPPALEDSMERAVTHREGRRFARLKDEHRLERLLRPCPAAQARR